MNRVNGGNKVSKHNYAIGGTTIAGVALLANQVLEIANASRPMAQTCLIAGASVIGGIVLDKVFSDNKLDRLFRMCGLENKNKQVPLIIKKTEDNKKDIKTLPIRFRTVNFENEGLDVIFK